MLEDFSYEGTWWLPHKPEDIHHGTLQFKHSDQIILHLSGLFSDRKACSIGPEIILGITTMNKKVTLFKTLEVDYKVPISGIEPSEANPLGDSRFICTIIFIGQHFNNKNDIRFRSMSINFTYLEQWFSPKGMFDANFKEDGFVVSANLMKIEPMRIDSLNSSLSISSSISTERDQPASLKLSHISYLQLEPDTPKDFTWYEDVVSNLECLFTLLMGVAVYPKQLIGYGVESDISGFRENIKIYYVLHNAIVCSDLPYWQLRSNYKKLSKYHKENQFSNIINNWFNEIDILRPVYELFSTNYYNKSTYLHVRFLAWIQAIEAFHRRVYIGKYLSDEDYAPIYGQLERAIPLDIKPDFRDSLKSRLKYGNELSLRTRLKLICNSKSAFWFKNNIGNNLNNIINKIVNTRNYLTHYEGSKKDIFSEDELIDINNKLEALLSVLLLSKIGASSISFDIIKKLNEDEAYKRSLSS